MTGADRLIGRFRKHLMMLFTRLHSLKVYCPFCQETDMSKSNFIQFGSSEKLLAKRYLVGLHPKEK
jgi:transposase-like protein